MKRRESALNKTSWPPISAISRGKRKREEKAMAMGRNWVTRSRRGDQEEKDAILNGERLLMLPIFLFPPRKKLYLSRVFIYKLSSSQTRLKKVKTQFWTEN